MDLDIDCLQGAVECLPASIQLGSLGCLPASTRLGSLGWLPACKHTVGVFGLCLHTQFSHGIPIKLSTWISSCESYYLTLLSSISPAVPSGCYPPHTDQGLPGDTHIHKNLDLPNSRLFKVPRSSRHPLPQGRTTALT